MINAIPILGWILSFVFNASLSVPFWVCWTAYGLGAKYFYWLPEVYHDIPFWNCVGLFVTISIIKTVLVPKLADVTNKNNSKD